MDDMQLLTDNTITVDSTDIRALPTVVDVDPDSISSASNTITFTATSKTDPSLVLETESRFLGPNR